MISVDSLLYKIDQKLNKLSSNEHQSIQLEDKILALNEAQIKLIKRNVFTRKYEDFQNLIVDYSVNPLSLTEADKNINQWTAPLSELNPEYLFYLDCYILADKGRCKDRKIWINRDLAKRGDLQFILNNNHYKPSFEYQETFNTTSADLISVYTDGTFTPKKLYISYIRYPKYIDKEGYINLKGDESVNQDSELEAYLEDQLIDLTVQDLAEYTENVSATQTAQFRIQTNEQT